MDNYKTKLITFILLLLVLVICLYYSMFSFSISYVSVEEIKQSRENNEELINSFSINNINTIYDKTNDLYYYSIEEEKENTLYIMKLDLSSKYKYKIVGYETNVVRVDYDKIYKVIIFNNSYYKEVNIKFTNLPIINIKTDTEITEYDTNSVFQYINPNNLDKEIIHNSKIHIRGDTSKKYDKKSYKIEMYKSDYEEEKNVNISNFYNGSSFILDATYRDYSNIRNVLAINLWNMFSSDFTDINVYSEFVEVFINNEYKGLYVFTEPINRRKLKLDKSSNNNSSVVIKSTNFKYPIIGKKFNNIIGDSYLGYELKYPNNKELFTNIWSNFLNKMAIYYSKMESMKYNDLKKIFNEKNYIDIILFNSFINNNDNQMKKNNYFYMKDYNELIYMQPWDMEFSFGITYKYEEKYNFIYIDDSDEIRFDIYHKNSKEINNLLISRYWELRNSTLTIEYIDNIIDNYFNLLNKGAAKRDSKLWVEYDLEEEISIVKTWLHNRFIVFDNYIKELENE